MRINYMIAIIVFSYGPWVQFLERKEVVHVQLKAYLNISEAMPAMQDFVYMK